MLCRRYILTHHDNTKERVWLMGGSSCDTKDDEVIFRNKHDWLFKDVQKGKIPAYYVSLYTKSASLNLFLANEIDKWARTQIDKKELYTCVDSAGKFIYVKYKYLKPESLLIRVINRIYFRITGKYF